MSLQGCFFSHKCCAVVGNASACQEEEGGHGQLAAQSQEIECLTRHKQLLADLAQMQLNGLCLFHSKEHPLGLLRAIGFCALQPTIIESAQTFEQ